MVTSAVTHNGNLSLLSLGKVDRKWLSLQLIPGRRSVQLIFQEKKSRDVEGLCVA